MNMSVSVWEKETFFAPQDVVIVGSGLVGLWSAFYIKKKHPTLNITILDRGLIPTGASTRNAGFACFGSLSEVVHDARTMGRDKMLELVEMRFRGLEKIRKHFNSKEIDFDMCGGYELYGESEAGSDENLNEEIEYINSLLKPFTGKKPYKLVDEKINAFGFGQTRHLVKNSLEGYLHSGKLVQQLISMVQGMGVRFFNLTSLVSFQSDGDMVHLETDRAFSLRARRLLICTNAFTKSLLPDADIVPARGQVLITTPIDGLPWKGTFHSDKGFYYFRNLGNRVLLGGARNKAFQEEETSEMSTTPLIMEHLQAYLEEVVLPNFKGSYQVESSWAGIMAMGSEKMPIVRKVDENVFCAVRMSGMGVALAPVIAQDVSRMVTEDL